MHIFYVCKDGNDKNGSVLGTLKTDQINIYGNGTETERMYGRHPLVSSVDSFLIGGVLKREEQMQIFKHKFDNSTLNSM